ncbi:hypothetical protein P5G62_007105 [Neobacillus sp. 179-C4.2 HS]|uniref:Uncharacterized protein n=1 Tax=Neobacillus driksii TaxID=3035913 RepID=A0ABV4YQ75_9BACI|nr:hypothetical protein [Neobacillus sp. 179.-C4.2 HS]MDP5195464.1 hypothetical protein [Neobacillus sp. 179.-C4.2 HS]
MDDVDGAVDGAGAATVAKYHEDVAGANAAMSLAEIVDDGAADSATVAKYREDAADAIAPKIDHA